MPSSSSEFHSNFPLVRAPNSMLNGPQLGPRGTEPGGGYEHMKMATNPDWMAPITASRIAGSTRRVTMAPTPIGGLETTETGAAAPVTATPVAAAAATTSRGGFFGFFARGTSGVAPKSVTTTTTSPLQSATARAAPQPPKPIDAPLTPVLMPSGVLPIDFDPAFDTTSTSTTTTATPAFSSRPHMKEIKLQSTPMSMLSSSAYSAALASNKESRTVQSIMPLALGSDTWNALSGLSLSTPASKSKRLQPVPPAPIGFDPVRATTPPKALWSDLPAAKISTVLHDDHTAASPLSAPTLEAFRRRGPMECPLPVSVSPPRQTPEPSQRKEEVERAVPLLVPIGEDPPTERAPLVREKTPTRFFSRVKSPAAQSTKEQTVIGHADPVVMSPTIAAFTKRAVSATPLTAGDVDGATAAANTPVEAVTAVTAQQHTVEEDQARFVTTLFAPEEADSSLQFDAQNGARRSVEERKAAATPTAPVAAASSSSLPSTAAAATTTTTAASAAPSFDFGALLTSAGFDEDDEDDDHALDKLRTVLNVVLQSAKVEEEDKPNASRQTSATNRTTVSSPVGSGRYTESSGSIFTARPNDEWSRATHQSGQRFSLW